MKNILIIPFLIIILVLGHMASAMSPMTDAILSNKLASGSGALIFKLNYYKGKPGLENSALQINYSTLDEFINSTAIKKKTSLRVRLYLLPPGSTDKEKEFNLMSQDGYFIFVGLSGEYTISRLILIESNGMTSSMRIFKKVNLENNTVKYLGDLNVFSFSSMWSGKNPEPRMYYQFNPALFGTEFKTNFPITSVALINEPFLTDAFSPVKQSMESGPDKRPDEEKK